MMSFFNHVKRLIPNSNQDKPLRRIWIVLIFLLLAVMMVRWALIERFNHDEHLYVAPALLLLQEGLRPYIDYPYFQMPIQVYLYAGVFKLGGNPLMTARFLNTAAAILTALLIYWWVGRSLGARMSRAGQIIAMGCVVMFVLSFFSPDTFSLAWNHSISTGFAVAAVISFLFALEAERRWLILLSGLCLGMAIGVRLTWGTLLVPFLLGLLMMKTEITNYSRVLPRVMLFGIGVLIPLIPVLLFAYTSWEEFWFGNFAYHQKIGYLYDAEQGFFHLPYIFRLPVSVIILAATSPAAFGLFIYVVKRSFQARKEGFFKGGQEIAFVVSVVVFAMVGAYTGVGLNFQYHYGVVALMTVAVGVGLSSLIRHSGRLSVEAKYVAFGMAITFLLATPKVASFLGIVGPQLNVPADIRTTGQKVKDLIDGGRVVTFAPIVPLLGKARIYPEFTVGIFAYRTAHLVDRVKRKQLKIIGPDDVEEFFKNQPPAGILVGIEDKLEIPLYNYAEAHGYQPFDFEGFQGRKLTLYLSQDYAGRQSEKK